MKRYGKYDNAFCELVIRQSKPFTADWIADKLQCSPSTVRRLIKKFYHGYSAWLSKGSGWFVTLYFPIDWTQQNVQAWLNCRTKTGKSRAKIRPVNGGV
jgi:hypothetical protein